MKVVLLVAQVVKVHIEVANGQKHVSAETAAKNELEVLADAVVLHVVVLLVADKEFAETVEGWPLVLHVAVLLVVHTSREVLVEVVGILENSQVLVEVISTLEN